MLPKTLQLPKYHEDPQILHLGCEENRSYYIPCSTTEPHLPKVRMLNGDWDFCYYETPFEVEDFTLPGYTYQKYDRIPVPGCIQMYGYDHHQYTNINFPFPYDPPFVPNENPTCVYHTVLTMSDAELLEDQFLNFEGVDSCFYLYVNQTLVGYSQVSHSTSEFKITSSLKEGQNDLTVVVLKWCDGSYLEDQDKFRMTGIFRDVYLLSRPKEHIRDFFVKTALSPDRNTATITVDLMYANETFDVSYVLTDSEGHEITKGHSDQSKIRFTVEQPSLWNAESPYLYTLTLFTKDEQIQQKVGIRVIEIINDIIHINGTRITFKGVNRHDSDPLTGFTISKEQAIKDLRLMKEGNINAIRTSHYPNAPWFTQLCNEYGFYVVGESDLECHGANNFYGGDWKKTYGDLVQKEYFANAILDRNQRNVIRDKNNPSIVIWSMGNEAGYSKALEDTGRFIKQYDPSRLLHYEGSIHNTGGHVNDTSMLDIYSTMYASTADIEKYLASNPKPYMLCEFIHSMGNGPGDIEDYFDCIYKNDRLVGGFVWEWCDHAIDRGITINGKKVYHYGGDSGEFPHDNNFCVDGMVSPDRIPHPAYEEYKNVIRPVRAVLKDAENGVIELTNMLDFTNLRDYLTLQVVFYLDGIKKDTVDLGTVDLEPHSSKNITVLGLDELCKEAMEGDSLTVQLCYIQASDKALTKAGHKLGFDQLFVKSHKKKPVNAIMAPIQKMSFEENQTYIIVSGSDFEYTYNKQKGTFTSLSYKQMSWITAPIEYNIWRAPIDNDSHAKEEWFKAGYDRSMVRVYDTNVVSANNHISITSKLAITAIQIQHIIDLTTTWTIGSDGSITVSLDGKRNTLLPFLPRFGFRFFLPDAFQTIGFLGYGPGESYIDKHRSSYYARHNETVASMYVDYIRPQEYGSHYGCDEVCCSTDSGYGFNVTADKSFSFSASQYTQETLTNTKHNYELVPEKDTVLCIDYKMSGVGSNSCGPVLADKYRLMEEDINIAFTIQFQK